MNNRIKFPLELRGVITLCASESCGLEQPDARTLNHDAGKLSLDAGRTEKPSLFAPPLVR